MDFHCHLDLYPDARKVYADALRLTEFVWLVTTSPRAYAVTSKVLPQTASLFVSPGLHPEVADKKSGELELFLTQLENSTVVGEVGLDGSARYRPHFALQQDIFASVVRRSEELGGRVLSVHSRAAATEVLDILEQHPGHGVAVLHWYTDSPRMLRRAADMGCWFSVGPAMLESANGRNLAILMPRDRVIPESDGPFAKVEGIPVMPWQAGTVEHRLSEVWKCTSAMASERLRDNGNRLIGLMTKHVGTSMGSRAR